MLDLARGLVMILFASRAQLAAENLALRHQLGVLGRKVKRPQLRKRDRIFWVWLSALWPGWRSALVVVKPATVAAWHRMGFKLYWRWKSRKHGCTAACDFFVVPTSTFRLLYAFVVLSHCRREIVHVNVTVHPTAAWTAQQIVEAFPGDGTRSTARPSRTASRTWASTR